MFTLSLSICLAVQGRAHSRPEWGPNGVCREGMCAHLLWDQGQDAFALDTEMTCGHAQAQDGCDGPAPTHLPRFRCDRLGGGPHPPTHILPGKPQPDPGVPASLFLPLVLTWDFSNLNIQGT